MMYDVQVTREDGFWVAQVDGVGATETRRLSVLEAEVRDYVAGMRDVDEDDVEVVLHFAGALPPAADKAVRQLRESRAALLDAQSLYDSDQQLAVVELRAADVSLRDAAPLMGVSFQRVQQLTAAGRG